MSVFRRGNKLWVRFRTPDGKWRTCMTRFVSGEEAKAKALLEELKKAQVG